MLLLGQNRLIRVLQDNLTNMREFQCSETCCVQDKEDHMYKRRVVSNCKAKQEKNDQQRWKSARQVDYPGHV